MKSLIDSNASAQLRQFFLECCTPPRCQAARQDVQDDSGQAGRVLWTQDVDVLLLLHIVPSLGNHLFTHTLDVLDELRKTCASLCSEGKHLLDANDLSIRFTHLPTLGYPLPTMPPPHGQLVQVCGSIVRMTTKRVIPYLYRTMCPRCHIVCEVRSNPFDRATQSRPRCNNSSCKKEEMQIVGQVWMDYAECRLQQRSNQSGQMPRSILVTLDDELSTRCTVGQFVEVIGLLFQKWRNVFPLSRPGIEPAIWAINVLPMEAYRGASTRTGTSSVTSLTNHRYYNNNNNNNNSYSISNNIRQKRSRSDDNNNNLQLSSTMTDSSQCERGRKTNYGLYNTEMGKFNPELFFNSFHGNLRARDVALVNSVCPQLAGLFAPRMSLLLSALGGASTIARQNRTTPCRTSHSDNDIRSDRTNSHYQHQHNRKHNNNNNSNSSKSSLPVAEPTSSMHIRSTIHCLFVGDPATGKSQLLQFAAAIAPRCTSTSGTGSTAAGLTVAASKEHGEWVLEPGALVLSDGGTCVIDELRTVNPSDRAALHEAMEQQTISVAKAGVVTTLRTSCAVLSACNPPHSHNNNNISSRSSNSSNNSNSKIMVELGVGGPLLSRFDFIFLLWDSPLPAEDERIAEHILSCNLIAAHNTVANSCNFNSHNNTLTINKNNNINNNTTSTNPSWSFLNNQPINGHGAENNSNSIFFSNNKMNVNSSTTVIPPLNVEEVAQYLWWVRGQYANVNGPLLNDEAAELLATYYELQRCRGASASLNEAVPITVRLLESLVRITQAHAKLHLQSVCTIYNAAMAVFLMERTAHSLKCPLGQYKTNNNNNNNNNNFVNNEFQEGSNEYDDGIGSKSERLYTSSRVLDRLFLDDSEEALEDQGEVLMELVETLNKSHAHELLCTQYINGSETHLEAADEHYANQICFDDRVNDIESECNAINSSISNRNTNSELHNLVSTFAHLRESEFSTESLLDSRAKGPLLRSLRKKVCDSNNNNNNNNNNNDNSNDSDNNTICNRNIVPTHEEYHKDKFSDECVNKSQECWTSAKCNTNHTQLTHAISCSSFPSSSSAAVSSDTTPIKQSTTRASIRQTREDNNMYHYQVGTSKSAKETDESNHYAANFIRELHSPHDSPYAHLQYEYGTFTSNHSHSPQTLLTSQLAEPSLHKSNKMNRYSENSVVSNTPPFPNNKHREELPSHVPNVLTSLPRHTSTLCSTNITNQDTIRNESTHISNDNSTNMLEKPINDNRDSHTLQGYSNSANSLELCERDCNRTYIPYASTITENLANNNNDNNAICESNRKTSKRMRSLDDIAKNLRFHF